MVFLTDAQRNKAFAAALRLHQNGYRPIPIPHKSKGPVLEKWQEYKFTETSIQHFHPGANVGILCGQGLICVDLDNEISLEVGPEILPETPCVVGREGRPKGHWFYRVNGAMKSKAPKFYASKTGNTWTCITAFELLSDGRQVVVGPSVHPSGGLYDTIDTVPNLITVEDLESALDKLFEEIKSRMVQRGFQVRDKKPAVQPDMATGFSSWVVSESGDRPGDHFSREHPGGLLVAHGWRHVSSDSRQEYWLRPGPCDQKHSASLMLGPTGKWNFHVYTCNAPCLEQDEDYSPYSLLAHFEYGGDFSAASSALRKMGYGGGMETIADPCPGLNSAISHPIEFIPEATHEPFPKECLTYPGFLDFVIGHNLRTTAQKQPELALASALALLSVVVGNRVRSFVNYPTYPNLYVLALGKTGSGKDHGRKINKRILIESGAEELLGSSQIGSDAGLLADLEIGPVRLYQLDEVGDFLQVAKSNSAASYLAKIAPTIKELKTSAGSVYRGPALAAGTRDINHPHLVILATTTPTGFWEGITQAQARDGLLSRFLIFESPGYVKTSIAKQENIPEEILRLVRFWRNDFVPQGNLTPTYAQADVEPNALERFINHEQQIRDRQIEDDKIDPMRAELWSRAAENVNQLALLAACSRISGIMGEVPMINLDDMNWAIRLSNWHTRRMVGQGAEKISENDWDRDVKKVRSRLFDGITKSQISNACQFVDPDRLKKIITHLAECGTILGTETIKPPVGRPKLVYRIDKRPRPN